ncbi:DUF2178 domain-containing protein [Paenibacillus sp. NPDC057934]|uniref:DUF2178 domain-containing protein n=1 Tax=Paenibacillus sp. NPDC057934 TaxID=3346282 RepID=UPI0036D79131
MNNQFLLLAVLIILGICTFSLLSFKAVKATKYKNDERWQLVQNKANKIVLIYSYTIGIALCVGIVITTFLDSQFTMSLNNVLKYSLVAILLRYTIELFALRHFDKVL